jgi:prevent-host-death family protein
VRAGYAFPAGPEWADCRKADQAQWRIWVIRDVPIKVEVQELRANLGAFLAKVQAGDELVVVENDDPIARVLSPDAAAEERLAELIARGEATPARRKKEGFVLPPPLEYDGECDGPTATDYILMERDRWR